jgi:shikimate dehydrogenase
MDEVSGSGPAPILRNYQVGDDASETTVNAFMAEELTDWNPMGAGSGTRRVCFAGTGTVALRTMTSAPFAALMAGSDVPFEVLNADWSPAELLEDPNWDIGLCFSPWKEEMARLVPEQTGAARAIGAVDTLTRCGPRILGLNVNTWAAQAALETACSGGTPPPRMVILGSGASARSVGFAARRAWGSQTDLTFSARNAAAGEEVAARFAARSVPAQELEKSLQSQSPSLLVNCTTWGETAQSESTPFPFPFDHLLACGTVFIDLNNRFSALQAAALEAGAQVMSGAAIRNISNGCRAALAQRYVAAYRRTER